MNISDFAPVIKKGLNVVGELFAGGRLDGSDVESDPHAANNDQRELNGGRNRPSSNEIPLGDEEEDETTQDNVGTVTDGGEKNPKRQCTTKSTKEHYVPDTITSTTEVHSSRDNTINDGGWDMGGGDDDDDEDKNKLPTTIQLSKELCRIVDPARYSNNEIVRSLEKLISWTRTTDPDFFKNFDGYSGITKVLDFLTATMNNSNCKGEIRMKFIEMAAHVMWGVFCNRNNINNKVVRKIAKFAMDCNIMNVLINASEEYNGGNDQFELSAVTAVWGASVRITNLDIKMSEDQAFSVFDTGIDIITHLKSVDDDVATEALQQVFMTLHNLVYNHNVNKKFFKDENILSKCLDVFKKNNNTWECRTVELMKIVLDFFDCCRLKRIFDQASDYEQLLPFIIICAKKFPTNISIQSNTIDLLNDACNKLNDKKVIERSGALAVLAELLASNDANERLKKKARTLNHRITAP